MSSTASTTIDTTNDVVSNVVPVDFHSEPVVTDFAAASSPQSDLAKRLAAEAAEQADKANTSCDKKSSHLRLVSNGRSELFSLNPYLIKIKEGWNCRDMNDPSNLEHIDELARSIAECGVQQPLTVINENGSILVTDGHMRLFATFRSIEVYKAEIKSVPVRSEGRFASEADRVISQVVRNSGKRPTVLEQGKVFVQMISFGWSEQQIASRVGMSVPRVTQILDLMAMPSETIKAMISSGKLSPTGAAATVREDRGDVAVSEQVLEKAAEVAAAHGKAKVTAKHVKEARAALKSENASMVTPKMSLRALVREVFDSVETEVDTTSDDERVTITLTAADWRRLANAAGL